MGVLWYKVFRDIWGNKSRTLQVVLIIGIGAAAIGMIMGTRDLVIPGMLNIWSESSPAMLNLFVYPPVGDDQINVLKRDDQVYQIEGLSNTTIEWRLDSQAEWRQGGLTARADYDNQQLNKLELVSGDWPRDKVASVEQGSDSFFGIPLDGKVYLRVNQREVEVQIGGSVYNTLSQPAYLGGSAQFYVTQEFYERLVGSIDYDQLMITAPVWNEESVTQLADRLQARLEKAGRDSGRFITDPNKHFFQDQMDGLFYLLGVLSALSLVLGLLLVYNTMNAIVARQVDQIGVLKAVGARTWQVLGLFMVTIFCYGLLAMIFAVPLGILGAWMISSWLVGSFGADIGGFDYSRPAIITMVVITLLAPLLASIIPVFNGARITVREAIATYGLSKKAGLIERLGARLRHVSRMFLLTISNTFRNKWRVVLMEVVLVLSGLIFMMVVSVRDAALYTVNDVIFQILGADVTFILDGGQRIDYIEELALAHPSVEAVESWALLNATMRPAGQPASDDDESALIFGVPLPTNMYGYQLRQGRWLNPDDSYAIVLNKKLADEVGVGVGDWVTIEYSDKNERDWQVVGLVFDPILVNSSNVPRDVFLHDLNQVGRTGTIWIDTVSKDPAVQIATAKALRQYFEQNHVQIHPQRGVFGIGGDATAETAQTLVSQFNFIVVLLGVMAVIIAAVGSIALSGMLSLSVMERIREIGVMRAIGASSWDVARLFIGEGLILGWLSWLVALPLSMPAGRLMVLAIGQAFNNEYVYNYTPTGALLWLGIITVLSILASWAPARSAVRVSVRQSLAYQ
ncbi:MAG: ABC transporter permease [Chloroflexota bacterium]